MMRSLSRQKGQTMRNVISQATFIATLMAASLSSGPSFAGSAYPPGAEPKLHGARQPIEPPWGTLHTPAGTVIDYGNLATSFGTGYTLVDQNSVPCKVASCTITVDANEQVGNADATGNGFAVCPLVDGNFSVYGCPYTGEVPSDYSFIYARARQSFVVKKGVHTVQVYLYLETASAFSDGFDIQYTVFQP
jgi:hypothetical protein